MHDRAFMCNVSSCCESESEVAFVVRCILFCLLFDQSKAAEIDFNSGNVIGACLSESLSEIWNAFK